MSYALSMLRCLALVLVLVGCTSGPDHNETRVKISYDIFKEELRIKHVAEVTIYAPTQTDGPSVLQGRYRASAAKTAPLFETSGVVDTVLIDMIKAAGTIYTIQE